MEKDHETETELGATLEADDRGADGCFTENTKEEEEEAGEEEEEGCGC